MTIDGSGRGAAGAIIVYDITSRQSYKSKRRGANEEARVPVAKVVVPACLMRSQENDMLIMTRLDDGLIDTRQVVDVESSKNASIRSDRTRIHKRAGFDRSISIRQHSHPPIEAAA
eukprot:83045-Hanusia_phi.AAC.2